MAISKTAQTNVNERVQDTLIPTETQPIKRQKQTLQLKYRGQSYTKSISNSNNQNKKLNGKYRGIKTRIELPETTSSLPSGNLMVYRGIPLGDQPSSFEFITSLLF